MARQLSKTLVDYLVIAISPALIVTLVGSLVFFLVQIFYQGNFEGRLLYILALFVVGAVLTGRISIEEGRERAVLFAVPLGLVTLLAINKFVAFQGDVLASLSFFINCGLIAVIWWSADKLTWDCTLIDESEEDSGEGLLESVGLERPDRAASQIDSTVAEPSDARPPSPAPRPSSRWQRFVERRRRPHAPGVWIIYFSLAALPLFGIGQFFIPSDDLSARQYAFHLLLVYTASGLGLLLSTSFLGLRRYLRQRGEEMPLRMVNLWLIIGGLMIAGVMMAAMLLPRPNAEYAVSELGFRIGSPDQKASSPHAAGRDGLKEDQPWARAEPGDSKRRGPVSSKQPENEQSAAAQGASGDRKGSARQEGDKGDKSSKAADNAPDRSRPQADQTAATSAQKKSDQAKPAPDSGRKPTGRSETDQNKPSNDAGNQAPTDSPGESPPLRAFPRLDLHVDAPSLFLALLKWLFYGALVAAALVWLWTHREAMLAALQALLDFWRNLFRSSVTEADTGPEAVESNKAARHFTDFTDPFAAGWTDRYSAVELVRYTFEALEAWARDHGLPRQPQQTPHEFARCLAAQVSALRHDAGRLADLYSQAAYASQTLPPESLDCLAHCWQTLTRSVPV